jgi:hypothetical protein
MASTEPVMIDRAIVKQIISSLLDRPGITAHIGMTVLAAATGYLTGLALDPDQFNEAMEAHVSTMTSAAPSGHADYLVAKARLLN